MGQHCVGSWVGWGSWGAQCLWTKGWLPLCFFSLAFGRILGWLFLFSEICLRRSVLLHSVRHKFPLHSECRGRAVLYPTHVQRHCCLSGAMEHGLINSSFTHVRNTWELSPHPRLMKTHLLTPKRRDTEPRSSLICCPTIWHGAWVSCSMAENPRLF